MFEPEKGWFNNLRKWKIRSEFDLSDDYSWLRLTNSGSSVKLWSKVGSPGARWYSSFESKFKEKGDKNLDKVIEIVVSKDYQSVFALIKGKTGAPPTSNRQNSSYRNRSLQHSRGSPRG